LTFMGMPFRRVELYACTTIEHLEIRQYRITANSPR
jgi:hypothetical protein